MSSRHDDVADLYSAKASELQRAVRRAITGPNALVEDACAYAWMRLLHNSHVVLNQHGFGWLYVVAIREAYRLSDRTRREVALGAPNDLPPMPAEDAATVAERMLAHEARMELLASLPERKRQMVVLHAAGFTYQEIARICNVTVRTVERQMLRGKRALRRLEQDARATAGGAA